MSFDAHEEKIRKIFAGDSQFTIPRNQRKYIWEEKQWNELLSDILYIKGRRVDSKTEINHFLGSFVLQENETKYEIIDGQQRITTLFLILSAICMYFNELKNEEEHGKTRQYLSGNIGLKSQYMRLDNANIKNISYLMSFACNYKEEYSEKDILNNNILDNISEGNKRVINCLKFFYYYFVSEKLTVEEAILIREIVLDMKVIHIASEDELDCYDIFEILNARGVDLEESELLKNYIFKYAQPEYAVDAAKELWGKIETNMEACSGNMEQFLAHFVTYHYYKPSKDEGVFRIIKSNTNKTVVYKLLDSLLSSSEDYISFYNPEKAVNKKIEECLEFYKLVNHRQFRPLFLALFEAYKEKKYTEKQLTNICVFLKNFSFAFTLVMGNTSNTIDGKIHELSKMVYTNPNLQSLNTIKTTLMKYYPSKEEFKNSFINLGFSNKNPKYINSNNRKRMFYIHREIEHYAQETEELMCNTEQCNLEHIMNDSDSDVITSRVGNILLLSESINGNMGNASFSEKKDKLKRSKLITVQRFLKFYGNHDEWTKELIIKRTDKIAELAYDTVWKVDTNLYTILDERKDLSA